MNTRLTTRIKDELEALDTDKLYDDMLDEVYSFSKVGGPFENMLPSKVLFDCDPIAYRCGYSDWLDSERDRIIEIEGDYFDREKVEAIRDEIVAELDAEIASLDEELAELSRDEDSDDRREEITILISALEAEIKELNSDL